MQPIPTPEVLDPERVARSDRVDSSTGDEERCELLGEALHETCASAQQLWHDLDAMRGDLLNSLPPDPHSPEPHLTAPAAPTGPDDDTGWDEWITAYATVTSVLCGPHGDSGYGLSEGRREAAIRRSAPPLRIHADHTVLGTPEPPPAAHPAAAQHSLAPAPARSSRTRHTAAMVILILLALRGLRPRRRGFRNSQPD